MFESKERNSIIQRPGQHMSDEAPPSAKAPTLFRNYISFAGALIVAASLVSIVLLFLIELTKTAENPYLGIVTYVILPSFLILGIVVVVLGMLWERRRRRRTHRCWAPRCLWWR